MKIHVPTLLTSACCLLAFGVPARSVEPTANATPTTLAIGATAPDFTLPDVGGAAHTLREYVAPNTVTVLNFWAFWCDTWKAEMPHLRSLAPQQSERHFRLVAVSVDGTRLAEFRQQSTPPPFPVLLDGGGRISRIYGIAHVPTVVVLDARGRVRYVHVGYPGNDALLTQIHRAQSELQEPSRYEPQNDQQRNHANENP